MEGKNIFEEGRKFSQHLGKLMEENLENIRMGKPVDPELTKAFRGEY